MKKIQEDQIPCNSVSGGGIATFDPNMNKKLVKRVQKILKKKDRK
jgi:hypothetical protein